MIAQLVVPPIDPASRVVNLYNDFEVLIKEYIVIIP